MLNITKGNRSVSWVRSISQELDEKGSIAFSRQRLKKQDHLFAHRSALFYTPTENIPSSLVGSGPLDIRLLITTPDYTDLLELRAYGIPRFWVDLIQRQTYKLRWNPIVPARVVFTRYDYYAIRADHLVLGMKALQDALKVGTTGRGDGIYLHYFGAIVDDCPKFAELTWHQELVQHPKDAGVRVQVFPRKGLENK
jgi:hypothetical protein